MAGTKKGAAKRKKRFGEGCHRRIGKMGGDATWRRIRAMERKLRGL